MTHNKIVLRSMDEVEKAATAMAKSGYFLDAKDAAQAVVKILAGREMGFGPFASMTGIYIIQGRPAIGANLMAAAVKSSGKYDYRVNEMTDAMCELEYFQSGKTIGKSKFTAEDARKAGTKNIDKFPRNMLFARAMSNGCRWYCPDIFAGAPTYTPEEMGATVNEAGDVIDAPAQPAQPVPPTPATPAPEQPATPAGQPMTLAEAEAVTNSEGKTYGSLDSAKLSYMANSLGKIAKRTPEQETKLLAIQIIMAARVAAMNAADEAQDDAARAAFNE